MGRRRHSQMKAQNTECNEEYQIGVNIRVNSEQIRLFKLKMSWCEIKLHGNSNTEEETV